MNKLKLFLPLAIIIFVSSCTVYKSSLPQAGVQAQVNIAMSDLEYVKDATGTATQSYLLGLPIGGTKYKRGFVSNSAGELLRIPSVGERGVNSAMYDALLSVPNADFVLPVSMEVVSNKMFLGREDSIMVKVKAFRLKQQ
ncbi:MAG TPA: hypothetical protein VHI78_07270 [Bacteroidales bacterium]|jgi:hypothetical protein|nr:hypothetical protein [Bacteroidales bacterium]